MFDLDEDPDARKRTTHFRSDNTTDHLFEIVSPWMRPLSSRDNGPVAIQTVGATIVREQWAAHPDPSSIIDDYLDPPRRQHDALVDHRIYLHREDGPAQIEMTNAADSAPVETWFRDNKEYQPTAHERLKWGTRKAAQGGTPFHPETLQVMAGDSPSMGAHNEVWKELRERAGLKGYGLYEYSDYTPSKDHAPTHRTGGVKAAAARAAAKADEPKATKAKTADRGDER